MTYYIIISYIDIQIYSGIGLDYELQI